MSAQVNAHKLLTLLTAAALLSFAQAKEEGAVRSIIESFKNARSGEVLVVAHRGAHDKFPENSLPSIEEAVRLGVDMVEIDVRPTKDGHLILMHDTAVDRTTNGKGKVSELTLAEISALRLKHGEELTDITVPTLTQAMLAAKGRVMVNLDKAEPVIEQCLEILRATGTERQAVLKGSTAGEAVKKRLEECNFNSFYIPIVSSKTPAMDQSALEKFKADVTALKPHAAEIVFRQDNTSLLGADVAQLAAEFDVRLWANSLNGIGCGDKGVHEDKAALDSPDSTWGWLIGNGITMIQTDHPEQLIEYLRSKKLHK